MPHATTLPSRRWRSVHAIDSPRHAGVTGAIGAAEHAAVGFVPMADDLAAAMLAFRRQHVDGALETIEGVRSPCHSDFKALVVVVAAVVTLGHSSPPLTSVCNLAAMLTGS